MAIQTQDITLDDLSLAYRGQKPLINGVSVTFPAEGWSCILGTSGCGKTTLLRFLAGLNHDHVCMSGKITHGFTSPLHHNIAYMEQHDSLLPWLTILDNVLLPFRFSTCGTKSENRERAIELLDKVGLADHVYDHPKTLSGGMRQRAALVRTLIQDKPVVLMDEPFSALDAVTRSRLQELSFELLTNKAVILITHDPLEAIKLARKLFLLKGKPTFMQSLSLPTSSPIRELNTESALLHQQIMQLLSGERQ
ncbi:ABC transporter ATP-binding protein [Vibrio sp.]|nr:ABC transporter ATP-binding protein [Vibrio sp.]